MDPEQTPPKKPRFPRLPRARFWLQASACAVVGWSLLHGSVEVVPTASAPASAPAATPGTGAADPAAASPAAAPAVQMASVSPLAEAEAALSRIDVVVARNDTLEHIFRRLKLDLADLAS